MFVRKNTFLLLTSLSMSLLTASLAQAETVNTATPYSWMPDHGRVLASGAAVSDVRTIGGDGMLPIFGNSEGFAYADFMGDYGSDDTYLVSPGLGYRKIINNQIAGAYFFADYEKVSLGPNFWVMSPGLEWMNSHWDAHVNGYFPTETTKQSGDTDFLSNYGNYSQVSFVEGTHNQYDELVAPYAVIGNGVDAEVGFSFSGLSDLRTRVYAGGYYYAPPNDAVDNVNSGYSEVDNITGVTAGFEQPISKNLKVSLFNSYDNVNNYAVGVSLIATFGQDSTVFSNNIHDRLLDPVERHVGIIDTGAGTYDQQDLQDTGVNALQYDNVYFLGETTEGLGDGTYGNSMELTQDTLDTIDGETSSSRIYLQGNSTYYVNESTAGGQVGVSVPYYNGLHVHAGQGVYGRSADYTSPGTGSEQPIILVDTQHGYNGFVVEEEGENTFDSLTIAPEPVPPPPSFNIMTEGTNSGIIVINDSNNESSTLNIISTQITGFEQGVLINNSGDSEFTVNIDDSMLNDNIYYGLEVLNYNTGTLLINIDGSTLNNNGSLTFDYTTAYYSDGMYVENNASGDLTINAINAQFSNNGNITSDFSSLIATSGIYAENNDTGTLTINATNSSFDNNGVITGDNSTITEDATGITLSNYSSGTTVLNATNATFNNNGFVNDGSGSSISGFQAGVYLHNHSIGTSTMSADESQFNNNGYAGLLVSNASTTTGTINVSSLSGSSFDNNQNYGIHAASAGGSTTINYTGATFSGNGQNSNYAIDDNINWVPDVAP